MQPFAPVVCRCVILYLQVCSFPLTFSFSSSLSISSNDPFQQGKPSTSPCLPPSEQSLVCNSAQTTPLFTPSLPPTSDLKLPLCLPSARCSPSLTLTCCTAVMVASYQLAEQSALMDHFCKWCSLDQLTTSNWAGNREQSQVRNVWVTLVSQKYKARQQTMCMWWGYAGRGGSEGGRQ